MSTAVDSRRHGALQAHGDATDVSRRHVGVAILLVLAAAVLRMGPLGPSSLWLDDAWLALVTRADDLGDIRLVGLTAPGFAVLLYGWLSVTGLSSLAAQALPFLFAVLAPGALYLVTVRRGAPPLVALLAGGLLLASPTHVDFSTRVKQYSLDTLLAIAVIGLAWWLATRPGARERWVWFTAAGVVSILLSTAVATVVAAGWVAAGLAALPRGRPARTFALASGGALALVATVWWLTVVRPAVNDQLRAYWAPNYLHIDDGTTTVVGDVPRLLGDLLATATPLPPWAAAVLLAGGLVWLVRRRPTVAVLVGLPLLVAFALAALQLAPLGGGRTDHHLLPSVLLGIGFAVEPLLRARREAAVALVALLALAVVIAGRGPRPYPQQDLRPLVAELEERRGPADTVLVYPSAVWAYALYTERPVSIVEDPTSGWRWAPRVADQRLHVLRPHRDEPERYAPEVADAVADADGAVWLIASHIRPDLAAIEEALVANGFEVVERSQRPGARLSRWER